MRCTLIIFLALLAGCGGRTSPGDQSLIAQAESLHRAFAPAIVNDPPLRNYLQQISTRMLAAARKVAEEQSFLKGDDSSEWMYKDVQFHVAQCGVPNAFTTGGTHVYVLVGALERCASEDELAAAFAHAYTHTVLRHIQHNVHALPADAPVSSIVLRFVERRFNLKQEQEADDLAFLIHARAGWDPGAFVAMLQNLNAPPPRVSATQSKLEHLPRASQEWSRPPIADARRFAQHREQATSIARRQIPPQPAERLLRAFPNCYAADDLPQQKEAQRDLATPISSETPNTFEKGPRERRQER